MKNEDERKSEESDGFSAAHLKNVSSRRQFLKRSGSATVAVALGSSLRVTANNETGSGETAEYPKTITWYFNSVDEWEYHIHGNGETVSDAWDDFGGDLIDQLEDPDTNELDEDYDPNPQYTWVTLPVEPCIESIVFDGVDEEDQPEPVPINPIIVAPAELNWSIDAYITVGPVPQTMTVTINYSSE